MRLLEADDALRDLAEPTTAPPGVRTDLLSDPVCGPPLRVYLALSDGRLGGELTPLDRFYNRYFWFCSFANAHRAKFGEDAGIEQQAMQILEQADCDFDWTVIHQLEAAAKLT